MALKKRSPWAAMGLALALGCGWLTACAHAPAPPAAPKKYRVTGRVLGHDGKPPRFGHARLLTLSLGRPTDEVQLTGEGAFVLSTDVAGYHHLEVTAVDHSHLSLIVLVEEQPRVEIRLGTYSGGEGSKRIRWRQKESRSAIELPLVEQPNGTWAAEGEFPGGTVLYQIAGFFGARNVNGTAGERWTYDNDGDYLSELDLARGKQRVAVDPARLAPPGHEPQFQFSDPNSRSAAVSSAYLPSWQAQVNQLKDEAANRALWGRRTDGLRARVASSADADEARLLRLGVLWGTTRARAELLPTDLDEVLQIPPSHAFWAIFPGAARALLPSPQAPSGAPYLTTAAGQYLRRLGEVGADHRVQGEALLAELEYVAGAKDSARARELYHRIATDNGFGALLARAIPLNPDRTLSAGMPLPRLDLPALEGAGLPWGARINNDTFKGSVTLIAIWGPWCVPCVAEMPTLHALYQRYQKTSRHLDIVSVAVRTTAGEVTRFRRDKWPMPWKHALIEGWFNDAAVKEFGLYFVPFSILVDEKGVVRAVSPELTPENLDAEVARLLGPG